MNFASSNLEEVSPVHFLERRRAESCTQVHHWSTKPSSLPLQGFQLVRTKRTTVRFRQVCRKASSIQRTYMYNQMMARRKSWDRESFSLFFIRVIRTLKAGNSERLGDREIHQGKFLGHYIFLSSSRLEFES